MARKSPAPHRFLRRVEKQHKRTPVTQERAQAVQQLRERERRERAHIPTDDLPKPWLVAETAELGVDDKKKRRDEAVAKFRALQQKEKEAMPRFITLEEQWRKVASSS